jgi:hypothetical protein
MPKIDSLSQRNLDSIGQGNYNSSIARTRGIYPAIVVPYGVNDNSEQNRIRARIVSIQDDGKIQGKSNSANEENYNNYAGKDNGIKDGDLVLCIPFLPQFFYVKPQVGEMVYVIIENPADASSLRYWIGPIITSKLKLAFQGYEDAFKIFNKTSFISNSKTSNNFNLSFLLPEDSDVAIQGRNDADLILKKREALLIAGKFSDIQNLKINTESPSYLKLKQINNVAQSQSEKGQIVVVLQKITANISQNQNNYFVGNVVVKDAITNFELINDSNSYLEKKDVLDWTTQKIKDVKGKYPNWEFNSSSEEFKNFPSRFDETISTSQLNPLDNLLKYSEALLTSTNINLYSPRGKFRGDDLKSFEINKDLKTFGTFSDSLHPAIFGDESIKLLDLIIRLLLNHIHTPQMPLLETELTNELKKYTVDGKLQDLISNHIRIN